MLLRMTKQYPNFLLSFLRKNEKKNKKEDFKRKTLVLKEKKKMEENPPAITELKQ